MKKIATLTLGALSLVTLASACSVEALSEEEIATSEEAVVCSNDQATWSIMAAIAEAAADELQRWQPRKDFFWNNSTWQLDLVQGVTGAGVNKCTAASQGCKVLKSLLALQSEAASGMQFGGVEFRPENLRSRMNTYWQRQMTCLDRPDNGQGDNCPAEQHKLGNKTFQQSATTCAGGTDILFKATYESSGAPMTAGDAAQLKNMLIFLGGSDNTFLQFQGIGDTVKIDPIDGTTGGSSSGSGSCEVATNPIWRTNITPNAYTCDAVNVAKTVGSCCSCGTVSATNPTRTWQPKPLMSGWFVCKPL